MMRAMLLAMLLASTTLGQEFQTITDPFDASSVSITGGTIDGAAIGGTTAAAGSFTTVTIGADAVLHRDASNVLALRTDGTAQKFRVYSSPAYADGEFLQVEWIGGHCYLQTKANGGGTLRNLYLVAGGSSCYIGTDAGAKYLFQQSYFAGTSNGSRSLGTNTLRWNELYLSGSMYRSTTAGITASTTQTQGQGALTSWLNEVATVANANDTVTLPAAVAGKEVVVCNNGANTLQIFPASGDNLGAGLNTATTLAAGSNVTYVAYDATTWEVK